MRMALLSIVLVACSAHDDSLGDDTSAGISASTLEYGVTSHVTFSGQTWTYTSFVAEKGQALRITVASSVATTAMVYASGWERSGRDVAGVPVVLEFVAPQAGTYSVALRPTYASQATFSVRLDKVTACGASIPSTPSTAGARQEDLFALIGSPPSPAKRDDVAALFAPGSSRLTLGGWVGARRTRTCDPLARCTSWTATTGLSYVDPHATNVGFLANGSRAASVTLLASGGAYNNFEFLASSPGPTLTSSGGVGANLTGPDALGGSGYWGISEGLWHLPNTGSSYKAGIANGFAYAFTTPSSTNSDNFRLEIQEIFYGRTDRAAPISAQVAGETVFAKW